MTRVSPAAILCAPVLMGCRRVPQPEHERLLDPRFKAVLAFAPWGMSNGYWVRARRIVIAMCHRHNCRCRWHPTAPPSSKTAGISYRSSPAPGCNRTPYSCAHSCVAVTPDGALGPGLGLLSCCCVRPG